MNIQYTVPVLKRAIGNSFTGNYFGSATSAAFMVMALLASVTALILAGIGYENNTVVGTKAWISCVIAGE